MLLEIPARSLLRAVTYQSIRIVEFIIYRQLRTKNHESCVSLGTWSQPIIDIECFWLLRCTAALQLFLNMCNRRGLPIALMREAENVVQADLRSKDSVFCVYVAKLHAYNQDEHEKHVAHGGHHL